MSLYVDPRGNKLLFERQEPRFFNIADLLEVCRGVLFLKLLKTLFVCLFSR